jgi:16S rRNA pseudouridine516 synthase
MIEDKVEASDFDRFVSVGRLDEATTGLLILTTDGGMVHSLASPQAKVAKRYEVTTAHRLEEKAVQRLRTGVEIELETNGKIETYTTAPAEAAIESDGRLCLVINEGKKRQIRRMVSAVGGEVVALHRRAIGRLDLRDHRLNQGDVLDISDQDVLALVGVDVEDKRP